MVAMHQSTAAPRDKCPRSILEKVESLPHICADVVHDAIGLACRIAQRGVGEGRPSHGFLLLVGASDALLADHGKCDMLNPFCIGEPVTLNRWREHGERDVDVRSAFMHDGAVVVDGTTGRLVAQSFFIERSETTQSGGARTKAAASIACCAGGTLAIKCSQEDAEKFDATLSCYLEKLEVTIRLGTVAKPYFQGPSLQVADMRRNDCSAFLTRKPRQVLETTKLPPPRRPGSFRPTVDEVVVSERFRGRTLYIYCNLYSISNVDVTTEAFEANIYMRVSWIEPDISENSIQKLKKFDFDEWNEDIVFNPRLRFSESSPAISNQKICKSIWRFGEKEGNIIPVIEWSFDVYGTFRSEMQLRSFPFDVLDLRVQLSSSLPVHVVQLEKDDMDGCLSEMRSDMISTDSRYAFFGPEMLTVQAKNPHSQTQFDMFHIVVYAKRDWLHLFWNIYLPVFTLTLLSSVAYVHPPAKAQDRFGVTLTICLMLVAYKFLLVGSLPAVPYNTHVDTFAIGSFLFLCGVAFQHAVMTVVIKHQLVCAEFVDLPDRSPDYCAWDILSAIALYFMYFAFVLYLICIAIGYQRAGTQLLDRHHQGWQTEAAAGRQYQQQLAGRLHVDEVGSDLELREGLLGSVSHRSAAHNS